jgi:ribonuclease P protein component
VLPARNRMRRSADFAAVLRRGRRNRQGALVVHLLTAGGAGATDAEPARGPLVGLIVGRAVGGSVVRHRVSRRLRAQLAARLHLLPSGAQLVVRALPGAAEADSARLGTDLDVALRRMRVAL